MSHPLKPDELGRDLLDLATSSAHRHDLQAVVVIQMDVHGGKDLLVVLMLNLCQPRFEIPYMMVVEKRHYTYHLLVALPLSLD